jgi:hypothetical protein
MKIRTVLSTLLIAALLGGGVWTFRRVRTGNGKEHEPEHEDSAKAPSRVKHGPGGEPIITLDAETQRRLDLKVATLSRTNLSREMKAYGRVLDPAPLVALVNDIVTALAASRASSNEWARLKSLEQDQNASARTIQAAEAAALRDQAALNSARAKLELAWGNALAGLNDLPAFARSLATLQSALLRANLTAGESLTLQPAGVRVAALAADAESVEAQFVGPAPTVDPQTQMQGVLILLRENRGRLIPGAAVTAYLRLPGEPIPGSVVVREAIVRVAGHAWVYAQISSEVFSRREILLEQPVENGWFVPTSVAPKEPVVIVGAQQLLSEELKTLIKETE